MFFSLFQKESPKQLAEHESLIPPTILDDPKPLHFKSAKGYHKFLAFIHIHKKSEGGKHPVFIGGHRHKVKHS